LLVEFKTRIGPTESVQFFFFRFRDTDGPAQRGCSTKNGLPVTAAFFWWSPHRLLSHFFYYFKSFSVSNYSEIRTLYG
jgi:hypothetical protein